MRSKNSLLHKYHTFPLRARLGILFALPLLIFLTVGTYTFKMYQEASIIKDQLRVTNNKIAAEIKQVQINYEKQMSAWSNVLLRGHETGNYHRYLKQFYELERKTRNQLKNLKQQFEDSPRIKKLIEDLQATHLQTGKILREAIQVYNGTEENAFILADRYRQTTEDNPRSALAEVSQLIRQQSENKRSQIELDLDKKENLVALILGLVLVVSTVVFFWVVDKNIGQPAEKAIQLEKALRMHRDQLEDIVAQRTAELQLSNAELESYSYSIAHDLRAPLRAVTSFSQILREDAEKKLDEEEKQYLARIIQAGKHMSSLIDDILALARVARIEIHRQKINLSQLAEESLQQHQLNDPQKQITVKIEPDIHVMGDENLLSMLINNLIDNAWKYSNAHSNATIEFGEIQKNDSPVFFVRDNGIGFDINHAKNIFKPFHRLHNSNDIEGSGVGLATVERIVKRHGGKIWTEAELNQGACFYFTLT